MESKGNKRGITMSRFESYIISEQERYYSKPRTEVISDTKAKDLMKTECKKAFNAYTNNIAMIYRGTVNNNNFLLSDPTKGVRKSANTQNFYTLLIDHILTSWSKYPKRSKSLVCSTKIYGTESYGITYVVLPFKSAKIGVCSDIDIWSSFKNIQSLNIFNSDIYEFINTFTVSDPDDNDPKRLIKQLLHADKNFRNIGDDYLNIKPESDLISNYTESEYIKHNNIIEYLNKEMDPVKNGFKLKKVGDKLPTEEVEVWVGNAPSLLIEKGKL